MAQALSRPAEALEWLRIGSFGLWRTVWRSNGVAVSHSGTRQALVGLLDDVAGIAGRLADRAAASSDSQSQANAAAICRWELLTLCQHLSQLELPREARSLQSKMVRHAAEAAEAAQVLSAGHRFRNLDRICRGGQNLDDHFEALARLRVKLAAIPADLTARLW